METDREIAAAKQRLDLWAARKQQPHLDALEKAGAQKLPSQIHPLHRYTDNDEVELASYVPRLNEMVWFNHGPVVAFVKRRAEDLGIE